MMRKTYVMMIAVTLSALHGATNDLKTSIIVPCIAQHAHHLYNLVNSYQNQTELPDEMVISLSSCDEVVQTDVVEMVREESWGFQVKLLATKEKLFAGENRNRACEHATGTLLICQDADDIPHPQRVEIITYFFKNYRIDHLIHQFVPWRCVPGENPFIQYNDLSSLAFFYPQMFQEICDIGTFTNGNSAMMREVFDAIKWSACPRGQDVIFNKAVYARFSHCIAIPIPLLGYRF